VIRYWYLRIKDALRKPEIKKPGKIVLEVVLAPMGGSLFIETTTEIPNLTYVKAANDGTVRAINSKSSDSNQLKN
jgi:hypothetical protein